MKAKRGDWVQIEKILLNPEERTAPLPEDTKKTPLKMRLKGFLVNKEANIGDNVEIETLIGRKVEGKLVAINPKYEHDFGEPVPEIITIGIELREILEGDSNA